MSELDRKISDIETDELIKIANSSTEVWQKNAINQAKIELTKRNITEKEQDIFFEKKLEQIETYLEDIELKKKSNEFEKYTILEMIFIVSVSPFILLRQWGVLYQLKQENYTLKFKQRLILLSLGMIIWFGCFYYSFNKWQKEQYNKESRY